MREPSKRTSAIGLAAVALLGATTATAAAQLGLPDPSTVISTVTSVVDTTTGVVTTVVDTTTTTVGGIGQTTTDTTSTLPVVGGVITDATGTVGGIVSGVDGTLGGDVGQAVDGLLSGTSGTSGGTPGQLSPTTVDSLLQVFTTGGAGVTDAAGNVTVDTAPPVVRVAVLSRLRQIAKTGSLRLSIASDEPSVVAVGGAVRPGRAVRGRGRGHTRQLVKWPAVVLAFRSRGTLQVTVKLSRAARVNLGRSRDARIGIATVAADLHRNQQAAYVKRHMFR